MSATTSGPDDLAISTPDRRLRVFVSSTLQELAAERRAVREAITRQRLTPVMFEIGARPHPPRELYRAYLAQSDVFVGIYAESYGWVAPEESVSGLEDEYLLSGDRPKLMYVKEGSQPQPRLEQLLDRIRDDDRASYKRFTTAEELGTLVADDLAVLLTERFTSSRRPAVVDGLRPGRLPIPPSEIVGRRDELDRVVGLVRDRSVRVVTVVGPGGIGKTRLVLEVAASLRDDHSSPPDPAGELEGIWFVDLTPVSDPELVVELVAAAFGVRSEGTGALLDLLIDRLDGHRVLLVLDNFEQVLAAAGSVARLLAGCPGLTVLATSRSALGLRGEHEVPLSPLPSPTADQQGALDQVAVFPAVQLFVARAQQVRPGFALTAANAGVVAELCRRLDGIPLALELAAAQLRVQTPATLLRRLGERLDRSLDLTAAVVDLPSRQRTLRATLEWSYSLLGPAERVLLARLSVFAQSWTLEAAEVVGVVDADMDAFATLSSLVGQSLVSLDETDPDELRFAMLASVRSYARERLVELGEEQPTQRRLTTYVRRLAETAGAGLVGPDNQAWAQRVDAELEDVRAALQRAVAEDDAETVVRIAGPLFSYWWSRGLLEAMRVLAEQAAELPSAALLPPDARALLLWARGMNRISAGQTDQAEPFLDQLLVAATDLQDARLRAFALAGLGLTQSRGDLATRRELLAEAVSTMRRLRDDWGRAFALSVSGQLALQSGDLATAESLHLEALAAAETIHNDHLRSQLLDLLGLDAMALGDGERARERFLAAARIHSRLLDQEGSANCLDGFAAIALAQGRADDAASLLAAAAHAREVVAVSVWPGLQSVVAGLEDAVRRALDPDTFTRAQSWGAGLSLLQALDYGATVSATPAMASPGPGAG